MKIYTKTGDQGETALFAGGRVRKDHIRIAAVGEVDELNALLGVALAENGVGLLPKLSELLIEIQNRLFDLGAELATPSPEKSGTNLLQETDVYRLEQAIARIEEKIDGMETRMKEIEKELVQPATYQDGKQVSEYQREYKRLKKNLEESYDRWEKDKLELEELLNSLH